MMTLLTLFLIGLATVLVLGITLALVGLAFKAVFAIAAFLLFTVAPIVLVGYLVVRFLAPRHKRVSAGEYDYDRIAG